MEEVQQLGITKAELWIAIGSLVTAVLGLVSGIVFIFLRYDKRTKEFTESQKDMKNVVENNTHLIRDLPHNIMLEIKAFRKE